MEYLLTSRSEIGILQKSPLRFVNLVRAGFCWMMQADPFFNAQIESFGGLTTLKKKRHQLVPFLLI
jgi:hypothetical protein